MKNSNHYEHEKYTVNLQNKNYKNNFNAAQDEIFQISNQNSLLISSVYINVNEKWVDSNLWLIDAFLKVMISKSSHINKTASALDESVHIQKNLLTIFYAIYSQIILISVWENFYYFTNAFSILFSNNFDDYQNKKSVLMLLKAFTKWALNHHSRKLMFVSNCKNFLRMIRKSWKTWSNDIIVLKQYYCSVIFFQIFMRIDVVSEQQYHSIKFFWLFMKNSYINIINLY